MFSLQNGCAASRYVCTGLIFICFYVQLTQCLFYKAFNDSGTSEIGGKPQECLYAARIVSNELPY